MVPSGTVPLFAQGFVGFPLAPLSCRIYKLGQKYRCENRDNGSGAKAECKLSMRGTGKITAAAQNKM